MQAVPAQALERLDRVAGQQELFHFVEYSRGWKVVDQRRQLRDRRRGLFLDVDAELCREPDRAQHAHGILAIAGNGITDQAQLFRLDVGYAADVVPYAFGRGIEIQSIDCEVAAYGIFSLVAENIVGQEPSVLVRSIVAHLPAAERRYLDGFRPG